MTGFIDRSGLPCLTWRLEGREWTAIIDTGFNGFLELPESLREATAYQGNVWTELASGHQAFEELYDVRVKFDGQKEEAEATYVEGTMILIGTALLRRHRLTVDFLNETVELERLTEAV